MREIGVHLEDEVVPVLQRPLESGNIGCAKTLLPRALDYKQPFRELSHQCFDDGCGPVRGSVVNDQDVILSFQAENFADDSLDVLLLVICRDDYYFPVHIGSDVIV